MRSTRVIVAAVAADRLGSTLGRPVRAVARPSGALQLLTACPSFRENRGCFRAVTKVTMVTVCEGHAANPGKRLNSESRRNLPHRCHWAVPAGDDKLRMVEGGSVGDREKLEDLWRDRLQDAKLRHAFACNVRQEVQRDLQHGEVPSADRNFALERALRAENRALAEYDRVLRIFAALVVAGKIPDEEVASGGALSPTHDRHSSAP